MYWESSQCNELSEHVTNWRSHHPAMLLDSLECNELNEHVTNSTAKWTYHKLNLSFACSIVGVTSIYRAEWPCHELNATWVLGRHLNVTSYIEMTPTILMTRGVRDMIVKFVTCSLSLIHWDGSYNTEVWWLIEFAHDLSDRYIGMTLTTPMTRWVRDMII